MLRSSLLLISAIFLGGCNHVNLKPGTLTPGTTIYSTRGGYTLRPAAKELLERRGYTIKVGRVKNSDSFIETFGTDFESYEFPNDARYLLKISEHSEKFRPIWCALNGFWWWRFNASLVNQETQTEVMAWTGRGCANSTMRKFDNILDQLEIKE